MIEFLRIFPDRPNRARPEICHGTSESGLDAGSQRYHLSPFVRTLTDDLVTSSQRGQANPRLTLLGVLIGASLLGGACSTTYRAPQAALHKQTDTLIFPTEQPATVEVYLRNGHVLIQDGDVLEGDMRTEVWADSKAKARDRARSVRLDPTIEDGVCRLRASHAQGAPLDTMHIRYRLRIPSDVRLRIYTRSAQVAVRGYSGDLEVHSETGEILARPAGGICNLTTTSGPIRLAGVYENAKVATKTGAIEVTLSPRENTIKLTAESESGPVLIDMADDCRMWLEFTTLNGGLDTDFPVVWQNGGEAEAEIRRFVGTVGESESPERVVATVNCGRAAFEVRRLTHTPPSPE